MNKIAIATGAALALSLAVTPLAFADDDLSCDEAKKIVVQAQTRLDNRAAQERVEELAELDAAKVARNAARVVVDQAQAALNASPNDETLKAALKTAKDALAAAGDRLDRAQKALDTDSVRLAELRATLKVAIQDRDKACDDGKDDDDDDDGDDDKAPPTTVIVRPDVQVDVHNNVVTPRGGVNTGGGPA